MDSNPWKSGGHDLVAKMRRDAEEERIVERDRVEALPKLEVLIEDVLHGKSGVTDIHRCVVNKETDTVAQCVSQFTKGNTAVDAGIHFWDQDAIFYEEFKKWTAMKPPSHLTSGLMGGSRVRDAARLRLVPRLLDHSLDKYRPSSPFFIAHPLKGINLPLGFPDPKDFDAFCLTATDMLRKFGLCVGFKKLSFSRGRVTLERCDNNHSIVFKGSSVQGRSYALKDVKFLDDSDRVDDSLTENIRAWFDGDDTKPSVQRRARLSDYDLVVIGEDFYDKLLEGVANTGTETCRGGTFEATYSTKPSTRSGWGGLHNWGRSVPRELRNEKYTLEKIVWGLQDFTADVSHSIIPPLPSGKPRMCPHKKSFPDKHDVHFQAVRNWTELFGSYRCKSMPNGDVGKAPLTHYMIKCKTE